MSVASILTGAIVLIGLGASFSGCARNVSCVDGTITAIEPGPLFLETNPHNPSVKDYHVGAQPRIRLDTEGGREVMTEVERAPSLHHEGDRVRVCYDRSRPNQFRIAGPAAPKSNIF